MASSGEKKAWEVLRGLDPADVCRNASVTYERSDGVYILGSFNTGFSIHPKTEDITNLAPQGEIFLGRYRRFFTLSALWYLVNAQDMPLSGRLVKPHSIKGGDMFLRGSHILPLERLAAKYGSNKQTFIERGKELGAEVGVHGDAALKIYPLPRIPVVLILWEGDEEFPARADLLLDSTCELHSPLDIIWSVAMLSVLVML